MRKDSEQIVKNEAAIMDSSVAGSRPAVFEKDQTANNRSNFSDTRTYAAREAVRQAREKIKRNDIIVSDLKAKNAVLHRFDQTDFITFNQPGQLRRPNDVGETHRSITKSPAKQVGALNQSKVEALSDAKQVAQKYRMKTGLKILSFFKEIFE